MGCRSLHSAPKPWSLLVFVHSSKEYTWIEKLWKHNGPAENHNINKKKNQTWSMQNSACFKWITFEIHWVDLPIAFSSLFELKFILGNSLGFFLASIQQYSNLILCQLETHHPWLHQTLLVFHHSYTTREKKKW
jgi:hypothetical protein